MSAVPDDMEGCSKKDFYHQFLQWRLLKSRQPSLLSAPGFKSFYPVIFILSYIFLTYAMVSIFLLYLTVKRATGLLVFLYYFSATLVKYSHYLLTYLPTIKLAGNDGLPQTR